MSQSLPRTVVKSQPLKKAQGDALSSGIRKSHGRQTNCQNRPFKMAFENLRNAFLQL